MKYETQRLRPKKFYSVNLTGYRRKKKIRKLSITMIEVWKSARNKRGPFNQKIIPEILIVTLC